MMSTLLIRHATLLVTMTGEEIPNGALFARDGWVERVGLTTEFDEDAIDADDVVDLSGHVVMPGLINTHHHLYQSLTRVVPAAQDAPLFDWLRTLYPMWGRMTPDHVRTATTLGLAELALSGCTTAFDHQYLWPNGSLLDDQIAGAEPVGIRFHVSRGSMSLGESDGGLPPDEVVENEDVIIEDSQRVVETFHDPERGAMTRVALAPCSPFSVTADLMAQTAELGRQLGVGLHTHLAETADENQYCLERYGKRPVAFAHDVDWLGDDVWHAHAVHIDHDEVGLLGETGTGIAHCPTSNMRLASGIPPILDAIDHGVPVGIGVDGSASNDSSHLIGEVRQALLLNRLAVAPGVLGQEERSQMSARDALRLATVGGARVLGRDDIGTLAPGMAADLIAIDLDRIGYSGSHDPLAALVMCAPVTVDHSWVHGRRVVADGMLVGVDPSTVIAEHRRLAALLDSP
ncbi:MAG: 8-oxoguanine deaminase [Acidimicrobiia bacterium]|nr:8-oxoguanine deaminase [Acidimicrobiia bacterium]